MSRDKCGFLALVLDAKGFVYYVRRGQYVGKNFGVVTKITKDSMFLKEVYQRNDGEWEERPAVMTISN